MSEAPFTMSFDTRTIEHLGVRMYSTLPPALAEIISNAYDAYASKVNILLTEEHGVPTEIKVVDDGIGLSSDEINSHFLIIGRNRREDPDGKPPNKPGRLPTGKKGLGKLALFGLATSITVLTRKDGLLNELLMNWDDLIASQNDYNPTALQVDVETPEANGTTITLTGLKRKSPFQAQSLADSLSRIFIFDDTFKLLITASNGKKFSVDNKRRYLHLEKEFTWDIELPHLLPEGSEYAGEMKGELMTCEKPIPPSSGLRGITLFSRGKLVNAPEFFSESTSSNFYSYLTGCISVDFIDLMEEDVISTNRQSINWDNEEMARLRKFLSRIVSQINKEWRAKRKEKKRKEQKDCTGIDQDDWIKTMPDDMKEPMGQILKTLGGEDAMDNYTSVVKSLYLIMPEYPDLHRRHLHEELRDRIKSYYTNEQYGHAADQGVKIYCELIRRLTGSQEDLQDLLKLFSFKADDNKVVTHNPTLQLNDLKNVSLQNIQTGQQHLSRGVMTGFRNPTSHEPIDTIVPSVFSELDCLNILSLLSYLITRLDNATVNP